MTIADTLNQYNEQITRTDTECLNSFNKKHDYESINSQQVSNNIIEVEYVCLFCNVIKYVYNYLEEEVLE